MRILLGLSGGVDSTYAAKKLIDEGNEVEAAVVLMHEFTSVSEAAESAASLGIPLHVIDAREKFSDIVKSNFVNEYLNARTPNPCIICNSEVKFIALHDFAIKNGFDKIATGHYASVVKLEDECSVRYTLMRGKDAKKDQTYMLWRLPQKILSDLVLPLSDKLKEEIRAVCREADLAAADRGDSQEICFIPGGDYSDFIESVAGKSEHGKFLDEEGNILGTHRGIIRYTVGQRRGLGISAETRLFVKNIDPASNTVVISKNDPVFNKVFIDGVVYSGIDRIEDGKELYLSVKLRYAAKPKLAKVKFFGDTAEIELLETERAVTPGQSAVLYDGDLLVAGGFISMAE